MLQFSVIGDLSRGKGVFVRGSASVHANGGRIVALLHACRLLLRVSAPSLPACTPPAVVPGSGNTSGMRPISDD